MTTITAHGFDFTVTAVADYMTESVYRVRDEASHDIQDYLRGLSFDTVAAIWATSALLGHKWDTEPQASQALANLNKALCRIRDRHTQGNIMLCCDADVSALAD